MGEAIRRVLGLLPVGRRAGARGRGGEDGRIRMSG